jgi:hypothetical protein
MAEPMQDTTTDNTPRHSAGAPGTKGTPRTSGSFRCTSRAPAPAAAFSPARPARNTTPSYRSPTSRERRLRQRARDAGHAQGVEPDGGPDRRHRPASGAAERSRPRPSGRGLSAIDGQLQPLASPRSCLSRARVTRSRAGVRHPHSQVCARCTAPRVLPGRPSPARPLDVTQVGHRSPARPVPLGRWGRAGPGPGRTPIRPGPIHIRGRFRARLGFEGNHADRRIGPQNRRSGVGVGTSAHPFRQDHSRGVTAVGWGSRTWDSDALSRHTQGHEPNSPLRRRRCRRREDPRRHLLPHQSGPHGCRPRRRPAARGLRSPRAAQWLGRRRGVRRQRRERLLGETPQGLPAHAR